MIISCSNSIDISAKLSKLSAMPIIYPKITEFTASEMLIGIEQNIKNDVIYIMQSLAQDANKQIMELLLTINAAKHSGVTQINLILPYIAYSRQDKVKTKQSMGMEVISHMLNNSGIDNIITIDMHNKNSLQLFDLPVINIDTTPFIAATKKDKLLVMPDRGALNRSNSSGNFVYLEKTRNDDGMSFQIFGEINGKDCLLIDDIIDSGKTLCLAAEFLIEHGAKSVEAYATHALLSKESCRRINNSAITHLTISNSVTQKHLPKNTDITDISPLIYKAMK